jgi:hypothetical protein
MISARYVGKTTEKEHFIFGKVYDIFGKSLGVFVHYKVSLLDHHMQIF